MNQTDTVKEKSFDRFKRAIKEMRQIDKASKLFEYITADKISKISAVLLFIWILAPACAMLVNLLSNNLVRMESPLFMPGQKAWYIILLQTGFLGCLIGVVIFIKSIISAKQSAVGFKDYVVQNVIPILLFLMLLWSVVSCFVSDDFNRSFFGTHYRKDGLLTYFAYCGIFCCGYAIRKEKIIRRLLSAFAVTALVLSVFALKDSQKIDMLFGLSKNAAIFINTNHFGYYICLAIMCTGMLFLTEKSKLNKTLWLISFAVMTAALVKNNSFGPYLAVVAGMVFSLILTLWLKRKYFKWVLLIVLVFISASLLMTLLGYPVFYEFGKMTSDMSDIMQNSEDAVHAGSHRWALWVNGAKFITEKPLFGYGQENLGAQYERLPVMISDRPHNEIIQFAASLGIPAALFYISALVIYLIRLIKKRKQVSITAIGIFCVVAAYLVSSMVGNTMYYTTPYFFMILGISVFSLTKESPLLQEPKQI